MHIENLRYRGDRVLVSHLVEKFPDGESDDGASEAGDDTSEPDTVENGTDLRSRHPPVIYTPENRRKLFTYIEITRFI